MSSALALQSTLAVDAPALIALLCALVACGTLGNFLVLRKEAMTGDAVAHAVLPGLVAGFLITGTRSITAMFVGAACAGIASILLANWARRTTRLESGATLGIVFTGLFAVGVLLLETQGARQVDLDPECVLFGSLETLFYSPTLNGEWYTGVPRALWTLAAAACIALIAIVLFMKELSLLAFDPSSARHLGVAPRWLERLFLALVSASIVASFEAVGSVLVIGIVACPALIAAPHARSVTHQITLSMILGSIIAVLGYALASHAPTLFGTATALNSAGMIALVLAIAVPMSHVAKRFIHRPM